MNDWIREFLEQYGSAGVGILMLVENIFPPIPSEIVMPWAGYAVSRGDLSFFAAVTVGSIGSFGGAFFWYWLAAKIGKNRLSSWVERHGAWLTISRDDLDRTEQWFEQWGRIAVLVCRMIPGIRTLISIPAGLSGMPTGQFSLFTAVGTLLWTALLAGLGWWLGENYSSLAGPLSWVSTAVILGLFLIWVYRLVMQRRRRRAEQE